MKNLHGYKITFKYEEFIINTPRSLFLVAYSLSEAEKKIKDWWTNVQEKDINTLKILEIKQWNNKKAKPFITMERYNAENKLIYG